MTEYKELAARLDHGVPLTVVDGIEVADTDAADATMSEAKARIEALEAKWIDADEDAKVQKEFLAVADARCERLEEALSDISCKSVDHWAQVRAEEALRP